MRVLRLSINKIFLVSLQNTSLYVVGMQTFVSTGLDLELVPTVQNNSIAIAPADTVESTAVSNTSNTSCTIMPLYFDEV